MFGGEEEGGQVQASGGGDGRCAPAVRGGYSGRAERVGTSLRPRDTSLSLLALHVACDADAIGTHLVDAIANRC